MASKITTAARHATITLGVSTFVALGGVCGGLYWDRTADRGERSARAELPALAATEIPKVLGFDFQTVERSVTEAYPLFTDDFRREFTEHATNEIIPKAREQRLISQVDVVGAGVLSVQRTSGSVLIYLNRTLTDKSKQTRYDGSRLRVDYLRVGDKWLINNIAPI